ncbi:MAG TPA: relaxase/mobilization nuclease domain-containing protein [Cyclobacteriaceae bacterium]|nr:relaxase/mobilization nuclease domain-containing protein [Cyclobacteriaceae bacterium]
MVAKVITGKTIRGVLSYNENKVKKGTAACIKAEGFPVEANGLSFSDKLRTFLDYHILNTKVKTNAIHISLNFDQSDKLDRKKLETIATDYLSKIGFGDQPYLVYQHFDAAHPHIHLITTNIKIDGSRIDLHNIGRVRSEQARKAIEIEYGLVRAQRRKHEDQVMKPADLSKATYGKSETKRTISNIVNAITRSYKFTSIHELNAVLKQYNVIADRGKEGTLIHSRNGLRYSLIDKNGIPVGVPIKASSIYGRPTMARLSDQFELNDLLRAPHKERVRNIIDFFELNKRQTLDDLIKHLVSNGIYPVIRQNNDGRIYGITFIDNTTKCVFNGSDLGKQYSAQGILNRFESIQAVTQKSIPSLPSKEDYEPPNYIDNSRSKNELSEMLKDLTEVNLDHSNTPYELKRKRKRRGRSI